MKNLIKEEIEKKSEIKMSISLENHLEHYGKPGMKWGKRSGSSRSSGKKSSKRVTSYKKPAAKLSSKQLADRIKRLEQEKKYQDLNKNATSSGRGRANKAVKKVGGFGAKAVGVGVAGAVTAATKVVIDKKMASMGSMKIGGLI